VDEKADGVFELESAIRAFGELVQQAALLQIVPGFKEKSCLILLPTYGCLESLSGQSGRPMRP